MQIGVGLYGNAKNALNCWCRRAAISAEWAGAGIPLNVVAPGFIDTPAAKYILSNPGLSASMGRWYRCAESIPLAGKDGRDSGVVCEPGEFADDGTDPLRRRRRRVQAAGRAFLVNQSASNRPPLTFSTNVYYGVGSVAFGVHMTALTSLLLLFFNQVVGLPAHGWARAMMVTLIFDAICDPLIGEWSDHTRSRWGRRHPFMYASALPIAIAFYFLFNPPMGWSRESLFIYLIVLLVAARVLLSLYEIPSSALGPELTLDYDQRTSLMSSRFFFGTLGGAA